MSFYGYDKIYTYGSKDPKNGQCGIGYIYQTLTKDSYRFNNFLPEYSIEMTGIITALIRWIEEVKPLRTVISTDYIAALP